MNVETIIAIITAGIAFVTSVASFTFNFVQNRKDRVQKVILDNRIKYMDEIREGFSSFISLANPAAIKLAKGSPEVMKIYSAELFRGYGKIKTYIKPFYKMDKELLDALDETYRAILCGLNGEKESSSLDELRENFARLYLKYDWVYWKYIQSQKNGAFINSDDAFDKIYYEFSDEINKKQL